MAVVPGVSLSVGSGVFVTVGETSIAMVGVKVGAFVAKGWVAVGGKAITVSPSCAWTVFAAMVSMMLGSSVGLLGGRGLHPQINKKAPMNMNKCAFLFNFCSILINPSTPHRLRERGILLV